MNSQKKVRIISRFTYKVLFQAQTAFIPKLLYWKYFYELHEGNISWCFQWYTLLHCFCLEQNNDSITGQYNYCILFLCVFVKVFYIKFILSKNFLLLEKKIVPMRTSKIMKSTICQQLAFLQSSLANK